ncbi:hypothetical protein Ddc_24115 [Ditylenchus destructor]|nr:hypothetical protein Ddc_24115 [Ditylenchus destructor]
MANINEAGNAIAEANLENAEDRNDEMLPGYMLGQSAVFFYILYPAIKDTTELQLLIGISYERGLSCALVLAYPIYRMLFRLYDHWRGWAYELHVLKHYAVFSLLLFLRMPLATLMVSLSSLYLAATANALNNAENRIDQVLPHDLLRWCRDALYLLYPVIKETTDLQLLIGISYESRLCFALLLAYPIYRVIPLLDDNWRGWAFGLTHWKTWAYEFYAFRLYTAFSLSMFLRMPLSIPALFIFFVRPPLRYRIVPAVLVASISYLCCYDVLTSGSLYELRKLSWTACVFWIIVFVCSINNAVLVFKRIPRNRGRNRRGQNHRRLK